MKTPSFWNSHNLLSTVLLPLGWLYSGATALRLRLKKPTKVNVPVICVGNLTAGGSGKTPTSAGIATLLKHHGFNPYFISRGYGGRLSGVIVDPSRHTAQDVGDEPLLLSRTAPVSINADRYQAALKAISCGADILIMDDGFQNPSLHKDLSFLIIDGKVGFGNCRPVPSGPLRENITSGLKRAQAAVIIGEDTSNVRPLLADLPIFQAHIKPQTPQDTSSPIIAFAGIGHPQKFYASLQECGFELIACHDFPDHHFYTEAELSSLIAEAAKEQAQLYTTAKDFVKIPPHLQSSFNVLEIQIDWSNRPALEKFLLKQINEIILKINHK